MTYRYHSLTVHNDGAAQAVHLPDIIDHSHPQGFEINSDLTSAVNRPTHVSFTRIAPNPSWTTLALEAALDLLGTIGICITSATNPGVVSNLEDVNDCGFPVGGAANRSLQFKKGPLVPLRLTCENRGNASLDIALFALSDDGAQSPIVVSDAATMPSLTITPARWTLGPLSVAGQTLANYNSLDIDFGLTVTPEGVQSNIYDTYAGENSTSPIITVRGIDPTWFGSIPIGGKAATHADTSVYLRKRTQGGTYFEDNATAAHIKFTMAGLTNVDEAARGSTIRVSETELMITGAQDATGNAPLIVTTQTAIT